MLSMSPIVGGGDYYLELARDDYYLAGGEPPGVWMGSGAEHFGLENQTVTRGQLRNLMAGYSPQGDGKSLVQNAGKANRQKGHDLTFSAPKSVSVAWILLDPKERREIESAHEAAVKAALSYLEKHATHTRRDQQGTRTENARMIAAVFRHSSSRAMDPQLHSHVLVQNVCVRSDGGTGTLYGYVGRNARGKVVETYNPLYRHKMAAGAIYRLTLATELTRRLGFSIVKSEDFGFEIAGFRQEVLAAFSTRRNELVEEMEKAGVSTPQAIERLVLTTRKSKQEHSFQDSLSTWKAKLESLGVTSEQIARVSPIVARENRGTLDLNKIIAEESAQLLESNQNFELQKLHARVAEREVSCGFGWEQIETQIEKVLEESGLMHAGVHHTSKLISSTQNLATEESFRENVAKFQLRNDYGVSADASRALLLRNSLQSKLKLSDQQRDAVEYLTEKRDGLCSIRILEGDAGSGKTTILKSARQLLEANGYQVIGACLSGQAAAEMQRTAGIRSYTLRKLEYEWKKGFAYSVTSHLGQLGKAVQKRKTAKPEKRRHFQLNQKTVLVVDEAAMADTDLLNMVLEKANSTGAHVILVGDEKQCQAISHGGGFSAAKAQIGSFRLTENWRQQDPEDRKVAIAFAEGDIAEALNNLAKRGRFTLRSSELSAINSLVEDWSKYGKKEPEKNLVLVGTHEQRLKVNEKCQRARFGILKGALTPYLTNFEGQKLRINDRVHIREPLMTMDRFNRKVKVPASTFGTIVGINFETRVFLIKLDSGKTVRIANEIKRPQQLFSSRRKSATHISLGYAVTTHASQGSTCDRAFVLTHGTIQSRELTYVQATRARHMTKFYGVKDEIEDLFEQTIRSGNKALIPKQLLQQISRSQRKSFADHDQAGNEHSKDEQEP